MVDEPSQAIKQRLEIEKCFGVHDIPRGESIAASNEIQLSELENQYKNCVLCPLSKTRTQVVFGRGNANAQLMFVGEAPGFDEDKQGEPFVGAAGQLLTKIIEAMKLKRSDVYIANCLKCRPPQNRSPLPSEIATCKPILLRQIEIIAPAIICTLGKYATQTLLSTEEPISKMRGRFFEWNSMRVMPTFHPAYLLRNPQDKKLVWQDMQLIMKEMGLL